MKFKTEQEQFWAGDFGSEYILRNQSDHLLASNLVFFSKCLNAAKSITSCIEFGANIGMNLKAIQIIYPGIELHGIEINELAAKKLSSVIPLENVFNESITECTFSRTWDMVLIKGVLIHINPDKLANVYEKLAQASNRYILLAEYYNPSPVSIPYRGHSDRLFKRDFAGEIMDQYPDFCLLDYGFVYHRDTSFPQDDITWFLLEKSPK